MFKDTRKNNEMVQGAYRKLKSYYYYNKNFMIMREKISSFEDDREAMYATFEKLAEALCHPIKMRKYIDELIAQIDFSFRLRCKCVQTFQAHRSVHSSELRHSSEYRS